LVLQGGFTDGGVDYRAGDVAEIDGDVDHHPVAMKLGEDCICLTATTGRLQAASRLVRLMHRVLDL
jgi:putative transcriptional regulator